MRVKRPFLLFGPGLAWAQTLADVLQSQSASLSTLTSWLNSQQAVYAMLSNAQDVTLLAPNNNAMNQLYSTPLAAELGEDANLLTAFLSYHILNGTYRMSDFTAQSSLSVPTFLNMAAYSNVRGGQRVESLNRDGAVTFISGNMAQSNIESSVRHPVQFRTGRDYPPWADKQFSTQDFSYVNGILHIIDSVLTIPGSLSDTLIEADLTAALGAVRRAGVEDSLNAASDMTIFAPNNAAFDAIGSLVAGMTSQQLTTVLNYHVIQGQVLYSDLLAAGTQLTAEGRGLDFTIEGESVFVNSARVVQSDLLVSNGVVHVVDACVSHAPYFFFSPPSPWLHDVPR